MPVRDRQRITEQLSTRSQPRRPARPQRPKRCGTPGGTIYVADEDRTALDEAGGQAPAGQFLPGHEKDVVWRTQQLTFVPDDNSRPYFELYETTQAEAVPYVNTPPAGTDGHLWPPAAGTVKGPTATGLPITPDAFAAMVGKAQISQIEQLYDNDVPASQSAVDARNGINAQVAALAAPVLPPGLKITVNYSESAHAVLVLTGPSGTNGLDWYTDTRSHMLQSNNDLKCQPDDHDCQTQKVPGGTVQWANWFGKAQPDELEYVPDDPNGTAVAIHLNPTGSSSEEMNAIPGSKYAPPQLTHDQLLALATSPGIADIIHATNLLGR